MTTEWAVSSLADKFTLDAGNAGELKFTVTNPGEVADTVVFDVIPGEGAQRAWFDVLPEPQKAVGGGDSVEFLVKLKVPAGIPPGRSDMTGLAYSANTAPEESSRTSGRVAFEWKPKEKPKPIWPWIAAAVVMILLVGGVVTWLLTSGGEPEAKASASPLASPSVSASPISPVNIVLEAESLVSSAQVGKKVSTTAVVVQDNCCDVVWSGNSQLWFLGHTVDETVSLTVTTPRDGTFALRTVRTTSYDYADTVWTVDGQLVGGTFAGYTPTVKKTAMFTVGTMKLAAGTHTLTLRIVGKNGFSGGYYAGVDQIQITSSFLGPDVVTITKFPILTK